MHIAYLTTEYPHPNFLPAGGIGSFVKTMADSLTEAGSQVTVFICFSEQDSEWMDGKINIVQIKKRRQSKLSFVLNRIYINKIVNKYIDKYKVQIIEAPDWEGIHAFCDFKIPLVTRIHGSVTYFNTLENRSTPKVIRFLEKRALRKSKSIVAVSNFSGKLTGEVFGFKEFKYTTIYNGIDSDKFRNTKDAFKANTILYFGTLIRKKGVLELPYIFEEVLKQNHHAKLILAGKDAIDPITGMSTWQLMQNSFSAKAKENIIYLGAVPYKEIIKVIHESTLCVFPSFAETFGLTTIETMASSKVLITSSFGWNQEILENGIEGYMENPKNHSAFADKINLVLNDKELAKQIGKQARKRVKTFFDQSMILDINVKFYKYLIDENK